MTIFAARLRAELVRGVIFEFSVAVPENNFLSAVKEQVEQLPGS